MDRLIEKIKIGRITGKINIDPTPHVIVGYDLQYFEWSFCNLPKNRLDGCRIFLYSGQNPPQKILKGTFIEKLRSGQGKLEVTHPDGSVETFFPTPESDPVLIELQSVMRWTNLGTTPLIIDETTIPGFVNCQLQNI